MRCRYFLLQIPSLELSPEYFARYRVLNIMKTIMVVISSEFLCLTAYIVILLKYYG